MIRYPIAFDWSPMLDEVAALPAHVWPAPSTIARSGGRHAGLSALQLVTESGGRRTDLLDLLPTCTAAVDDVALAVGLGPLRRLWIGALAAGGAIGWHKDVMPGPRRRFHVPLRTAAGATMRTSTREEHMRAGEVWEVDPTQPHEVVNDSGELRLHLVADFERMAG